MKGTIRYSLAIGASAALALGAGSAWAQGSAAGTQPQRTIQMVQAKAELATTIDAKKAKQGEPIKAKLADKVQIPDQQELPKNTVLEGHVDQVQPSEHKSDSTVVVTFDKVRMKDGKELPIKATVVAIAEPVSPFQQGQAAGGGGGNAGMMPGGGGSAPGGAPGGGAAGGPGGSAGAAAPAPAPEPMPQEGGAGAEQQGAQQAGKNGVPGVMLTSDIHSQNSATFASKGRNVKVPNGTEMQVALAVIPPGVHIQ